MATIAVNMTGLAKIRRLTGLERDCDFAKRIQVDPGTVSRVLAGRSAPGPRFIAGVTYAFGAGRFADCFTVAPDDETDAA